MFLAEVYACHPCMITGRFRIRHPCPITLISKYLSKPVVTCGGMRTHQHDQSGMLVGTNDCICELATWLQKSKRPGETTVWRNESARTQIPRSQPTITPLTQLATSLNCSMRLTEPSSRLLI